MRNRGETKYGLNAIWVKRTFFRGLWVEPRGLNAIWVKHTAPTHDET